MIRHLFRLIWNRRRSNALLVAEIFVCFLVLFAVSVLSIYTVTNYRKPLGFAYRDVLSVEVGRGARDESGQSSRTGAAADAPPAAANPHADSQRAILDLVKADPAVVTAAWAGPLPFSQSNETRRQRINNRDVRYSLGFCTDEYKDVLGIEIVRGRWFSPEDEGAAYEATVITEDLARLVFGAEDPLGRNIAPDGDGDSAPRVERRVVGVLRAFRQEGEMDSTHAYALFRLQYPTERMARVDSLAVRLRPGSDASVEARLARTLQAASPELSFRIEPLENGADFNRRAFIAPILMAAIVAGFLILMVALGLSGVLWQSVTTRIREIGVRRALGASAGDVRHQVMGELLVMATVAMGLGVIVVLQFPFLDLLGPVPKGVFFAGLSLTIVSLYALALLCSLQPARLATTVHPAEALRYE